MTVRPLVIVLALLTLGAPAWAASDLSGRVLTGGVPVPGATVTATQGSRTATTSTSLDGAFRVPALEDGLWTLRVEMPGFAPVSVEVRVPADGPLTPLDLTLLPFEEAVKTSAQTRLVEATAIPTGSVPSPSGRGTGFQRAPVRVTGATPPPSSSVEEAGDGMSAADGLLINGSVNNGAASPFAQLRAFGNNRPGQRSQYNGNIGFLGRTSAWDTRPFSFGSLQPPKPDYANLHVMGTLGGPLKVPWSLIARPTFFLGIQRTVNTTATTQSALVPTAAERAGDFTQSVDVFGQTVVVRDPRTGLPFAGGAIPRDRLSPQAAALLTYYPTPNVEGGGGTNFQAPTVSAITQENVQFRFTQPVNRNNQLFGTFAYQRTSTDALSLFNFADATRASGFDAMANWNHRFSQTLSLRTRYQWTRQSTRTTPYFAGRTNVSGEAGIAGNDQAPENWGPPRLSFTSGIIGLTDVLPARTSNASHAGSAEGLWFRGRHNLTVGGELRRNRIDIRAQEDPRGLFAFTGAATGSDLADFLLGIPSTSAIATGNPDKYLRGNAAALYLSDDWRTSATLTLTLGLRWEYEGPLAERSNRLVNLSLAPDFSSAALTRGAGLTRDLRGFQPRLGASWRPVPGSSLLVRGGYGLYRNQNVYQPIVTALAQQPPLSTTFFAENTPATPLTMADGFPLGAASGRNTYAVDPPFRIGAAHTWQASVRRDLPAALTATLTYLGTRGTHLPQMFLPNTVAPGAVNPCPSCPSGFVYLTSNATSLRNSLQVQVRRRLRSGFTSTAEYTLAKATDNSAGVSGATVAGASIAQDWRNLEAERSRSAFDQRHLLKVEVEYTTGVGATGGGLLTGLAGALWKNWTVATNVTAGSGLPITPVVLVPIRGTGVVGTLRASLTGVDSHAPTGHYLNPAAYTTPAAGTWGDAGRNSISGPRQFQLNVRVARTFPYGRRMFFDWQLDASNLLNRVTYAAVNTIVGSPQFGLPTRANAMRQIQTSLRLRF